VEARVDKDGQKYVQWKKSEDLDSDTERNFRPEPSLIFSKLVEESLHRPTSELDVV